MELTVGPNQYFWKPESWSKLYAELAETSVDRVVLGEVVCSKRLVFYQDRIPAAVETLKAAGKNVAITSLALITLKRERKWTAELVDLGLEIEINDLTALAYLPAGAGFAVGPLVNVYNEGTLCWLASRGATRVCLPPELPLASVETLALAARTMGVAVEVWGHGRLPLAISGRCYHARLHGRTKDNCQFACEEDPDGLEVRTLDDRPFLTVNGVQTLSQTYASAAYQIEALRKAGVDALRLSPQSRCFPQICRHYRNGIDGVIDAASLAAAIQADVPGGHLSDGFLTGARGADWSGGLPART